MLRKLFPVDLPNSAIVKSDRTLFSSFYFAIIPPIPAIAPPALISDGVASKSEAIGIDFSGLGEIV